MPVHNSDIADVFNHIADLLEIKGDNPFRIRAYRNAARTVMELPKSASQMIAEKEDLSQYPGLGEAIIEKINKLVRNERLSIVDDLEKEVPKGLSQLLEIAGLGGPRIHTLHKELNIDSIESLKKAAMEHKISELKKFGKKTEEKILAEIERVNISKQRVPLARAEQISCFLIDYLKKITGIKEVTTAGSFRRRMESVGDLDILVTHVKNCDVMERFVQFDEVERVLAQGETKTSVILRSGLQVDLRSVPPESYAAALLYFTGSKEHGIALRKIALSMGLKINEYGIFKDEKKITASTEKAIYEKLGLTFIEPELRENRGDI
jgi:DNA polymerase (family 10)